jgi:uncharacterized membrane-anchored protein
MLASGGPAHGADNISDNVAVSAVQQLPSGVPEATILFWVVKVLTPGTGETASDFLFQHLAPAIAIAIGLGDLIAALTLQFRAHRYVP